MRRSLPLTFVASALVAASCPGETSKKDCARACEVASQCGVLPSILGGSAGDDLRDILNDCEFRCENSDEDSDDDGKLVSRTLGCLESHKGDNICQVDACVDTVGCLTQLLPENALGAPEVTFQLIDGERWTLLFQPELCAKLPADVWLVEDEAASLCRGDGDPCTPSADVQLRPPLCVDEACLHNLDNPDESICDGRMCDFTPSAALDCAYMGIETVQFGWYDDRGAFHLDPNTYTCDEASAGQVVEDIGHEVIHPAALFNGKLTPSVLNLLGAPQTADGRPFCWVSHPGYPGVGWLAHAGPNLIPVASPLSALLARIDSTDPNIFPRGCSCLVGDIGCEDVGNKNCENGADDDRDGLVDAEDPGCAP